MADNMADNQRSFVRVLRIPHGQKTDEDGRSLGSDWNLAFIGNDPHTGADYYVTTDRIRASEVGSFSLFDPPNLAEFIVDAINARLNTSKTALEEVELWVTRVTEAKHDDHLVDIVGEAISRIGELREEVERLRERLDEKGEA